MSPESEPEPERQQLPLQSPSPSPAPSQMRLTWPPKNLSWRWFWSILSLLLMVALGYLVLSQIDWVRLRDSLTQVDVRWLLIAFMAILVGQALRLWRSWQLLQRLNHSKIEWRESAYAMLGAQMINWLSPVRLGDVWRVWQLRNVQVGGMLWAALAVLIEKSLDSVALALVAFTLLLLPVPTNTTNTVLRLGTTAGAGLLIVMALASLRPAALHRQLLRRFPQLQDWIGSSYGQILSSSKRLLARRDVAITGAITVLMWGGALLTNLALAQALHIAWQAWMLPLLVVLIQTASIVSPVPGNVGIIPLVTIGVFTLAGFAAPEATAFGFAHGTLHYLLIYGVNLVWFLVVRLQRH